MKTEKFSVLIENNVISLFAIEMIGLNKGSIFFRRNENKTIDVLPEFENDKNHINSIIENFSNGIIYDEKLLHSNIQNNYCIFT